jgi:hypothetical protein
VPSPGSTWSTNQPKKRETLFPQTSHCEQTGFAKGLLAQLVVIAFTAGRSQRRWIMKARSTRLNVESLDGRIVPSAVAYGDLNHDSLADRAAITGPRTVTVSLANANGGGYTVSAILTAPSGPSLEHVQISDVDADGDMDVNAYGSNTTWVYGSVWLGNGDGTFGSPQSSRWRFPRNFI